MTVARRLLALERILGRPAEVTWQEAYAAADRLDGHLYAALEAFAAGRQPPVDRPELAEDEDLLEHWRQQRGIPEPDMDVLNRQVLNQLLRIERSLKREAT